MKFSLFVYIAIATLLLIIITIIISLNFPINVVFYITVVGQIFLVVMVYKILTDNYSTDKTFDHFYEDRPIKPSDVEFENEKYR